MDLVSFGKRFGLIGELQGVIYNYACEIVDVSTRNNAPKCNSELNSATEANCS